jgi:hypothetical protein
VFSGLYKHASKHFTLLLVTLWLLFHR